MITIIITAYNVSKTIYKAIQSCINQTYKDLEILVINDCSTDNTLQIVQSVKDPRIRVVNNSENLGAGMSRRIGTKEAKGEYTAFLDGDDYLDEDFIQTLYDLAIKNNADVVSSGMRIIDNSSIIQESSKQLSEYNGLDFVLSKNTNTNRIKYWLNNKIVRRSIWDKVDYSSRRYIEDTQTAYYVLFYSKKVIDTPYVGYNYVQNQNSLVHTSDDVKNKIYKALCAKDVAMFVKEHKKKDYKYTITAFILRISEIKQIQFTNEIINKYKDELSELFVFMLQLIKF